ncbi:hypothetical protein ATANTOWER_008731 [Ataeniobius toweri]|uniref:Uncharacterized protein n=1 Tax=Ataeniobius toweri TaxID=208326 RepID=A0ABU7BP14_9TELE|nr:hypothetical protein [Ataeniobius toweri]
MEFKRKFNMEDSPSCPALSNYSSKRLCSTNQCQVLISPWPIILQGSALKDLHPSPPFGFQTPSKSPQASTPPPGSDGGEDISKSNPKMFIQVHVILSIHVFHWGPSAKEINIH